MDTKKILLLLIALFTVGITSAQSTDDVLNLLIEKGLVKQNDADSIRADYALKQQEVKEKQKTFNILSSQKLAIGGYLQTRYQSLQEKGKPDGFDIRRARFDIKGNFSPSWEYRLQTDFAVNTKIIDAYFAYKPYDFLKITGGQFLIPFSLESTTADSGLETIDRAQATGLVRRNKDVLGDQNGRDIGLQLSGSLFKTGSNRFILDYYLAYFNGQGVNIGADKNDYKDLAARIISHPLSFLDFGVSYSNGYDNWATTAAKDIAYNTDKTIKTLPTNAIFTNQLQTRFAADLAINYNDFTLRAEYIQAQQGTYVKNGTTIQDGWYAQVGYFVLPKKLQFVAKYDTYDPAKNSLGNTYNAKYENTTFYTLGANYYPNNFVKFQINYKHKNEFSINKDEIVAQLQLKF